ncbi:GTP cyclohydrolase N terminal-domain-containing protein [Cantharellus anzutake]|uniref:GTP cyclohydrolase N terminal-domain-containing protein n=1 Tax=Cantharellus anzutake TaxID=1750568 RepID=UPI001908CBF9|nr:GTP cyclohydrolase N terminal-domain-containing protein [Cantharellus anzutake]KAF8340657.1 GTP cyclohydrolase N terminal-domain-containing protein [Cantharellus anzutake]
MASSDTQDILNQILHKLESLTLQNAVLQAKVESLTGGSVPSTPPNLVGGIPISNAHPRSSSPTALPSPTFQTLPSLYPQRVIITTYPDQSGIRPTPLQWGAKDPLIRGPVVCSRNPSSIKVRNAIGAHSGSYSIYRALAVGMGALNMDYKPDYNLTQPPVDFPPQPSWFDASKIVAFDPWGHVVPQVFKKDMDAGLNVRPSIAITKAHIKLSEIDHPLPNYSLPVDGTFVLRSRPLLNEDGSVLEVDPGVELPVVKAAVEPVWYLPGVAGRFGMTESLLRRALFEETGGMYPELITRPDIKVFLPPIGGLTVYIFGNPAYMSDPSKELTLRVHDECNGSDVFGSDICTCKPYLIFAIMECVRTAQRGGVGVVVYFRKEGRALGEVTKYLVYNLRKRGGDSADRYFKSTESVAGVKDMRFQALMPDVLHWLGITKIHNMVSMSDMKYNAIVDSGIPILKRYDIPEHLIPPDSRVEIDAKIAAGYFTSGRKITEEDLKNTVGRAWEDTEH